MVKNSPVNAGDTEEPLEKEMATHSSILAWKIPWTKQKILEGCSPQSGNELDVT